MGQTLWKIGIEKMSLNSISSILSVIFSPLIILGIALYGLATVIWIYLLSKFPLSVLYPLQSLAYVFGMVVALLIFHEHISATRWIGVAVIIFGVYLISK
jgi:drug/metabolite transporter (DMT)-like permease